MTNLNSMTPNERLLHLIKSWEPPTDYVCDIERLRKLKALLAKLDNGKPLPIADLRLVFDRENIDLYKLEIAKKRVERKRSMRTDVDLETPEAIDYWEAAKYAMTESQIEKALELWEIVENDSWETCKFDISGQNQSDASLHCGIQRDMIINEIGAYDRFANWLIKYIQER